MPRFGSLPANLSLRRRTDGAEFPDSDPNQLERMKFASMRELALEPRQEDAERDTPDKKCKFLKIFHTGRPD